MNNKRRLLRKRRQLSTGSMEPIVSQWLERALADEQGRAFLRAALHKSELPVIDLEGSEPTHDLQVVQA